jgi:hypothetical protein
VRAVRIVAAIGLILFLLYLGSPFAKVHRRP